MDYSIVKSLISERLFREEGFIPTPYKDSEGHLSQGIGTNLEQHPERKQKWMTLEIAKEYLNADIDYIIKELRKAFPLIDSLNDARKVVLVDMAYNLGIKGLMKFQKMLEAIRSADYKKAADEIRDSKAATQTGHRYIQLADIMETGVYKPYKDIQ